MLYVLSIALAVLFALLRHAAISGPGVTLADLGPIVLDIAFVAIIGITIVFFGRRQLAELRASHRSEMALILGRLVRERADAEYMSVTISKFSEQAREGTVVCSPPATPATAAAPAHLAVGSAVSAATRSRGDDSEAPVFR